MPEPVQSVGINACEYDPSHDVCSAAPAPTPSPPPTAPNSDLPAAVAQLVDKHPPAGGAHSCAGEGAALLVASGNLIRSAGAMAVAAPSLIAEVPAVAAFIGSAIAVGATAAQYLNCTDERDAAGKLK